MSPDEFQAEAIKTWTAPLRGTKLGRKYLRLGLVSEIGEVAGVLKRIIRDGWTMEVWRSKLILEIGDVAWYKAVEHFELGTQFRTGDVVSALSETDWLTCDESLDRMSEANITWDEVFAANVAKLRDRQARGAIKGEGDAR